VKILGQMDRLLLRELGRLTAATLGGVVSLYLVIDFADRAPSFTGRAWGKAAAELYLYKAAVVAYELAPAALIIASALLVTQLSRRGELTGLFALGVTPLRLALPVAAFSAALGFGLFWLGEKVVVGADARAEEIQVKRFNRWGDWGSYHSVSSWLRGKQNRIFHLGTPHGGGWEPATVMEIAPPFRLARRIEARRLEPVAGGAGSPADGQPPQAGAPENRWRFYDAVETKYGLSLEPGGSIEERRANVLEENFPESAADLELRSGRPRQLPWRQLREQTRRREHAGQRAREYRLALAERVAQPLQVVPAALAAVGLALTLQRPRRRMPLAGAAAMGIALTMVLWAVSVVAHAISLTGPLPPWLAAAMPSMASSLIAVVAFRRR
jgi:lipopolysaccharide export system permease protein